MAKKYGSIKWEITFVVVVLLVAVIGILSFFILNAQKKSLTNEVKLRGLSIAKNLANSMADFILTGDELSIAKIISETMNNKGVKYALVADVDGAIISHNNVDNIGEKYEELKPAEVIENEAKEEFGDARLHKVIQDNGSKSAKEILDSIVGEIGGFVKGYEQSDDIAIMVVKKI